MYLSLRQFATTLLLSVQLCLMVSAECLSQELNSVTFSNAQGGNTALATVIFFKNNDAGLSAKNKKTLDLLINMLNEDNSLVICINNSTLNNTQIEEGDDMLYAIRKQSIINYLVANRVMIKNISGNNSDFLFPLMESTDQEKNTYEISGNNASYFYFHVYVLNENSIYRLGSEPNYRYSHHFYSKKKYHKYKTKIAAPKMKAKNSYSGNEKKVASDSDGDGVPDTHDKCPTIAGSPSNHGCPMAPPPPPPLPVGKPRQPTEEEKPKSGRKDRTKTTTVVKPKQASSPGRSPASVPAPAPVPAGAADNTPKTPAKVAYIYPKKLIQNEPKKISVVATINSTADRTISAVKLVAIASDSEGVSSDMYVTDIAGINIYDHLTITIDDPVGDFKIDSVIGYPKRQRLKDSATWQWTISTSSTKKAGELYINIVPEPFELQRLPPKKIKLAIEFESWQNQFRRNLGYIMDPKILISIILIPLIAYFGKRYFDKKEKK